MQPIDQFAVGSLSTDPTTLCVNRTWPRHHRGAGATRSDQSPLTPVRGEDSLAGGADGAEALTGLDDAGGHALLGGLAP